ncbi:MAG: cupin domain-containing protein [Euryarchaeota archaeon]|nr:cupin domain-containing protein [Euryarchaeota archaeon]
MKHIGSSQKKWTTGRGYSKRVVLGREDIGLKVDLVQEVVFRKGDKVPLHHHEVQTEIFYAITETLFEINGEDVLMRPGDVLFCEPGDVHGNPTVPEDSKILVLKVDYKEDDMVWD